MRRGKEEEEERRIKEEEEKRKEKKAQMKSRKRVKNLPDLTGEGDDSSYLYSDANQNSRNIKPVVHSEPIITGGPWTEDEFSELARLMAKFPGGTSERWEKIATHMNRTVFEVTKMSSKVMIQLVNRTSNPETSEILLEPKVKQKTKGGKLEQGDKIDINLGSDEFWSVVQQKSLEKALKQFPKGTDQRWDKIARYVPDKLKEECMMRFKYLAEKIKKKKEELELTNSEMVIVNSDSNTCVAEESNVSKDITPLSEISEEQSEHCSTECSS